MRAVLLLLCVFMHIAYAFGLKYPSFSRSSLSQQLFIRRSKDRTALSMGIDVSGLKIVPIPDADLQSMFESVSSSSSDMMMSPSGDLATDLQNVAILMAGVGYFAYEKRPRGDARMDLLEIRRSSVPNAGMGVFSKQFIAADTLVGSFPGYITNVEDALKSKKSSDAKERAKKYMWSISDEEVLDPTNENGKLELELEYLGGLVKVSTAMARVNEPPPRADCNLYTKIEGGRVLVYAERDVAKDEELFLDYGAGYVLCSIYVLLPASC